VDALDGKVAVVTGAAGGIGLALTRALARESMNVVMADIDAARLAAAAETVESRSGQDVIAVPTDVSDAAAVAELERRARDRFGRVHLLCNNAGVVIPPGRLWKVSREDFGWMLSVNLWGVVHGIQAFVPAMLEHGEPAHVVNTASIAGLLGFPRIGAYGASKFAIVGLSESLLQDLRERGASIGVSVLCPGAIATELGEHSDRLRTGASPGVNGSTDDGPRAALEDLAVQVIDAVHANRFWILTHPGYRESLVARHEAMLRGAELLTAPGFFQ